MSWISSVFMLERARSSWAPSRTWNFLGIKLFTYKFVFDSCFNFFLCLLFLQGYWGYCILVLEQISSRILYKIRAFIRASKHSLINPSNLSEYPRNRLHCGISLLHILCARASTDRRIQDGFASIIKLDWNIFMVKHTLRVTNSIPFGPDTEGHAP